MSEKYGYNMIHFTPINELGSSNSAYSLSDHSISKRYFEGDNEITEKKKIFHMEEYIKNLNEKYGN